MTFRIWSEFWGGMIDGFKVNSIEEISEDSRYCYTDFEEGLDIYEGISGFLYGVIQNY